MPKPPHDPAETLARAARTHAKARYLLKLYVAGVSPKSEAAIRTVTEICETQLQGRYDLEIIDLYQQPALAQGEQIIAVPTLIKQLPLPLKRIIGDMANEQKVLVGLDLRPKA